MSVGPCEMFRDRTPRPLAVIRQPDRLLRLEAAWERTKADEGRPSDCMHPEAWTLLTPAKPKGGGE